MFIAILDRLRNVSDGGIEMECVETGKKTASNWPDSSGYVLRLISLVSHLAFRKSGKIPQVQMFPIKGESEDVDRDSQR